MNISESEIVRNLKEVDFSTKIRKDANKLYGKNKHDARSHLEILLLYSKSIASAPQDSEELALGYNNRSVLALHCGKPDKSIIDIDRALKITKSSQLRIKLMIRKAECIAIVGQFHDNHKNANVMAKVTLNEAETFLDQFQPSDHKSRETLINLLVKAKEKVNSCSERLYKSKDEEEDMEGSMPFLESVGEFPCISDAVSLKYNKSLGRYLVANRAIGTGETLIIEDSTKYPMTTLLYITCSHCLEQSDVCIPCDGCVFAMYCSEKCKINALKNYHAMECSSINYCDNLRKIMSRSIPHSELNMCLQMFLLARRLVAVSIREAKEQNPVNYMIDESESNNHCEDPRTKGLFKNGVFNSQTFRAWTSLKPSSELPQPYKEVFAKATYKFASLLRLDMLKDIDDNMFNKLIDLITELKLVLKTNSFVFCHGERNCCCKMEEDDQKHPDDCTKRRGMQLAPFCTFISHSCAPNARYTNVNGKIVVFAMRLIKKNEDISMAFGHIGLHIPRNLRQKYVQVKLGRKCTCVACKEQWPTFTNIEWGIADEELRKFFYTMDTVPPSQEILAAATKDAFLRRPHLFKNFEMQESWLKSGRPWIELDNERGTTTRVKSKSGLPKSFEPMFSNISKCLSGKPEEQQSLKYNEHKNMMEFNPNDTKPSYSPVFDWNDPNNKLFNLTFDLDTTYVSLCKAIDEFYMSNSKYKAEIFTCYLREQIVVRYIRYAGNEHKGLKIPVVCHK